MATRPLPPRRDLPDAPHGMVETAHAAVVETAQSVVETAQTVAQNVKPKLRGWIHAVTFPLVVVGGLILVILADTTRMRIGMGVFTLTAALLFGTSALYHRGTWSPRWHHVLKRADHANIFLIIAGTSTAFALSLLPSGMARTFLLVVWVGAVIGAVFKVVRPHTPRWISTPLYVILGWVSVFFVPQMADTGGWTVVALLATGGVLYTLGALVYGFRRPDPLPAWFGFHEVFHVLTILAFATHFLAATLVVAAGTGLSA
jgi:hemolysin III